MRLDAPASLDSYLADVYRTCKLAGLDWTHADMVREASDLAVAACAQFGHEPDSNQWKKREGDVGSFARIDVRCVRCGQWGEFVRAPSGLFVKQSLSEKESA